MKHTVTPLIGGKPLSERRPFEDYRDQPDTAERVRLQVQRIPFALPERKLRPSHFHSTATREADAQTGRLRAAAASPDSKYEGGTPCP
jgi:hypothetical protein